MIAALSTAGAVDSFDFKAIPKLNKMQVLELARCDRTLRRENAHRPRATLPTGKTHVVLGLELAACQKGMSVSFTSAAALVNELIEPWSRHRLVENNSAVGLDAANLKTALGKINRQYANL